MGAKVGTALFDQTRDYIAGFSLGAPGSMGALVLVPFMQMAGQSGLLIVAVLTMTVTDIAFDLLNVLVFHGGMFGMGLASALSYYAAMIVSAFYFLSGKCVFRFSLKGITFRVAVVGGGNVAMDAARCAKRLGADVTIVYRRTRAELPARAEEVEHAMEEGIIFRFLTNPTEVLRDERGAACGLRCLRMELGEPDASGRRRPVEVLGSEHDIEADCVIMALGTSPNPLIRDTTNGLETQRWGGIIAEEETGKTSRESVYAGGDAVTGAATVILAMGAGRQAARAIDEAYQSRMEKNNAGD